MSDIGLFYLLIIFPSFHSARFQLNWTGILILYICTYFTVYGWTFLMNIRTAHLPAQSQSKLYVFIYIFRTWIEKVMRKFNKYNLPKIRKYYPANIEIGRWMISLKSGSVQRYGWFLEVELQTTLLDKMHSTSTAFVILHDLRYELTQRRSVKNKQMNK